MNVLDALGKGAVATSLDVDNALYMTAETQAVDTKDQARLIGWGILAEYLARVLIAYLALEVVSGDTTLFKIGDTKVTPVMVALLLAGLFLFFSNLKDVGDFLVGREEEQHVEKQPFDTVLAKMSGVNTILSIDTVVAVTSETDDLATVALILSVSSVIRLLFVRQIAGFMRRHPSFKILTGVFLVLIGVSLMLQGVGIDFPEEAFGVGILVAIGLMWLYRRHGSAWFATQLGVEPADEAAPAEAEASAEKAVPAEAEASADEAAPAEAGAFADTGASTDADPDSTEDGVEALPAEPLGAATVGRSPTDRSG